MRFFYVHNLLMVGRETNTILEREISSPIFARFEAPDHPAFRSGHLKPNWCIIGDSKHGNKQFRRLPNISRSSITGRESKRDWAICHQQNLHSNTMQIYRCLNRWTPFLTAHISLGRRRTIKNPPKRVIDQLI